MLYVKEIAFHNVGGPHLISWRSSKQNTAASWGRRDSVSRQGQKSCLNSQTPGPSYRCWTQDCNSNSPASCSLRAHPMDFALASPRNPVSQFLTINLSCFLNLFFPVSPLPPYYSATSLLGIYPREMRTYVHTKVCSWMFTAALFVKVKN